MTSRTLAVTLLLAAAACGGGTKRPLSPQEMLAADPLPLAKGARWTYDVKITRYDADTDKDAVRSLRWTTEVIDAREGNGVTAFRVRGWPTDLADADGAPVATERTLLRAGNNFLWGTSAEPDLDGAEGWFSWPVIDGQRICPRGDASYCWQIAAVETGYALSFYTGPDEQTFELEPGTGVSRYHFARHGALDTVEARLVSFQKGQKPAAR